jgi:hypothetical protein
VIDNIIINISLLGHSNEKVLDENTEKPAGE